jgi:hypothetical protein
MALEDYTLAVLRDDLLEEFGRNKADAVLRAKADRKLNDAQLWLSQARKDWPWRVLELAIDVQASRSTTGDVSNGGTTVLNVAVPDAADLRRILIDGAIQGQATSGHLIADVTGTTYTLQSQWLGSDGTGQALSIAVGYLELPNDFSKWKNLEAAGAIGEERFHHKTPLVFDKVKRERNLVGLQDFIYTVKPDPLGLKDNKFLVVYPFISTQMTLHGNYWRSVPKLVEDDDVPIIPRDDRIALLHAAYWFMAVHLKVEAETINFYMQQALSSLTNMGEAYDLSDDTENIRDDIPDEPNFVQMPAGYPDIRDLS